MMRIVPLFCFLVLTWLLLAPDANAEEVGTWSDTVNGVKGRLIVKDDQAFNGTKIVAVYLELRNETNVLGSIDLYYDAGELTNRIVDGDEALVSKPRLADMSVFVPEPMWLVIPDDGLVRFRVSVSGYGIPKDSGVAIQMMEGLILIGPKVQGECFLEGTFVSEPKQKVSDRMWHGTIKLPRVEIPR